jgi:hypothetical protein
MSGCKIQSVPYLTCYQAAVRLHVFGVDRSGMFFLMLDVMEFTSQRNVRCDVNSTHVRINVHTIYTRKYMS